MGLFRKSDTPASARGQKVGRNRHYYRLLMVAGASFSAKSLGARVIPLKTAPGAYSRVGLEACVLGPNVVSSSNVGELVREGRVRRILKQ
jgi:hypothetical protein